MEREVVEILEKTEKGLDFGIKSLNLGLNGISRETIYTIGASPKAGKTSFVDFSFLLVPYLKNYLGENKKIKWIYFSYEISRVRKMMKLAPFFFKYDFHKDTFFHKGVEYPINSNYLSNKMIDPDEELITIKEEDRKIFEEIYETRLVPLFGEKVNGKYVRKGCVTVFEKATNPTGIRNTLMDYAEYTGTFETSTYKSQGETKSYITGYRPNDPELHTIVIIDHIRKVKSERGFDNKQIIDKLYEYEVELRNFAKFTFVNIAHLNRNLSSIDRMRFNKERLHPTGDDFKGSGNPIEESDVVMTMMNPLDERYMLKKHYGHDLSEYPNYRSLHIIDSRDTEPFDVFLNANFNNNIFTEIKD